MNFALNALIPFFGGTAIGFFFFGGLWLTVRRAALSPRAPWLFAASSLLRTAVALVGMYWLTGGDWRTLLPCVAGFYLARHAVTRLFGSPLKPLQEKAHAS